MKTMLVGGAVRDALLGIPIYDQDWLVVGACPQEMLDKGFIQVGKDFPVFLHPKTKEEYALARTERKKGRGYHGFEVFSDPSVSVEEDLIRRDLTINAMAMDEQGNLIDPFNGKQDLEDRVLRHVSSAFEEDPLRVLRLARFAAKLSNFGFKVAPETLELMRKMVVSGELAHLTPERVWQEVVKALTTDKPSEFFVVLNSVGALELLFPELYNLIGVEQPLKYHPEGDVWKHTLMVLDASVALSDDVAVRFSALVHDLGKGVTPKELWPKHHGHEQAGVPLVKDLCRRYKLPNQIASLAEKVTEYHGIIHQGLTVDGKPYLKASTYLKVIVACQGLKETDVFSKVLLACEADSKGRLGFENNQYLQKILWQNLAEAAKQVDNKNILATGVKGAEIGLAIDNVRLQNIKNALKAL